MAPAAGGIAGDVDATFPHQLGLHQRDGQLLLAGLIRRILCQVLRVEAKRFFTVQ
jgi:hypothetical protein